MRRFILLTILLASGLYGTLLVYGEGDQQRRGLQEARVTPPLALPEPVASDDGPRRPEPAVVAVTSAAERPATARLSPAIQRVALSAGPVAATPQPIIREPVMQAEPVASTEPAVATVPQLPAAQEPAPIRDERRVNTAAANVRAGPSTDFPVVGRVTRGEVVGVVEADTPGWVKVRIEGDGIEGWVAARLLTD